MYSTYESGEGYIPEKENIGGIFKECDEIIENFDEAIEKIKTSINKHKELNNDKS